MDIAMAHTYREGYNDGWASQASRASRASRASQPGPQPGPQVTEELVKALLAPVEEAIAKWEEERR